MAKTSCKKGQYYCNTDQKCKPIPDGYKVREDGILVSEGSLRDWFGKSKSKGGKPGWVNVKTGGTCASDEPGEGVPKCVSRSKYDSMSKKERESAHRRKRTADPNQQSKRNAAKPTYVSTDKKMTYKKKKKTKKESTEFTSLPLVLEVPQSDGEFKLGLMFRESLEQDRGMLFIFENNDYHTFHMKNTFIPLDIAFMKEDGTIDSIEELDPMSPIPVGPESEIRYAVEVNRGWFAENDVNVGDALLEEEDLTEGKDKKGKGSGTKDACYHKVKSRYSVWPSAYASGALVKCRKVGAANWGNKSESVEYELNEKEGSKAQQMAKARILQKQKESGLNTTGVKGITKKGDKVFHNGKQLTQYGIDQLNVKGGAWSDKARRERALKSFEHRESKNHYNWRDSFDLEERTIAQQNSMQQRNRDAARSRAQEMAKARIAAKNNPAPAAASRKIDGAGLAAKMGAAKAAGAGVAKAVGAGAARAAGAVGQAAGAGAARAAGRPQYQQNRDRLNASRQQQRPAAGKSGGFLDRVKNRVGAIKQGISDTARGAVSGVKRVVGGVADAATGNRFDFDKRGGQRGGATKPAGAAAAGAAPKMGRTEIANRARMGNERVDALKAKNAQFQAAKKSGNLAQFRKDNPKLSGRERAQQMAKDRIAAKQSGTAAGGAQDALNRNPGQKPRVQDALNRNPRQRPVGTPAVKGSTATLTSSAGSLQKNKQKANRVANAMNNSGRGNVSVGKITGGQGVSDF